MQKIIPWLLSAILSILLGAVALYYKNELTQRDLEIQSLKTAAAQTLAEATAKLKAADDRVAKTDASAAERIAAADAAAKATEALAAARMKETSDQAAAKIQETNDQARVRVETLEAEARNKLQAANLPEATVDVTFRKAVMSNGSVALFRNTSQVSTPFAIVAVRPATNQSRKFTPVLDGGRITEIGEREGWAFLPGDVVRVVQPGHKPRDFNLK